MPSAVGLEIADGVVRALEVEGGERRQRVRRFLEVPLDPQAEPAAALAAACAVIFREHRFPRSNVVVGIDSAQAILRDISVPFVGDEQIRKTLKFSLESYVHSHEIDNLVADYYSVEQQDKATQLMVAAVPKPLLSTVLEALQQVKVDPSAVDLDVFALFNATMRAGLLGEYGNVWILSIAPRYTKVLSLENGALRSARFLRLAQNGDAPRTVESLARELNRFLLARPVHEPMGAIFITGDVDDERFAALAEGLTRELGLEVKSLDARARLELAIDEETAVRLAANGGVALGLALKGLGLDDVGLDFRQEEFVYQRRFDAIKKSLLLCLTMIAILLGQVALYYHNRTAFFVRNRDRLNERQLETAKAIFTDHFPDEKLDETKSLLLQVEAAKKRLEEQVGKGESPMPISGLDSWTDIFAHVPEKPSYLTMEKLVIDVARGRAAFSGKVDDRTLVEKVANDLNLPATVSGVEYPGYGGRAKISPRGIQPDKDGKYTYEIEIELRAEEGK